MALVRPRQSEASQRTSGTSETEPLPVTTTIPTTSHTYDEGGIFTASLTVTNTAGTSTTTVFTGQMVTNYGLPRAQTTLPVTVSPLPYGVSITPDQAPTASFITSINGSTVFFDGSGSSSPVGSIATYKWNFGDGTASRHNDHPDNLSHLR